MSSPIPPDPYTALGVVKDADISVIRTAHRKLVLKHHPDRIKDPALKDRGKDEFQKIQQAYELLSDPIRRSRYDDKIKLAELRRDAMMRDAAPRPAYPSRHAASATASPAASREWNSDDQTFYEFRRPKESYFDSKERFEEPTRTTSRKYPEYDRSSTVKKAPSEAPKADKSKASARWASASAFVSAGIKIKAEADKRKESKRAQEERDREKRRAREEKERSSRRTYVESDSDSDTATRVTASTIRPSKPSARPSRDSESRRAPGHGRSRSYTDDSDQESTFSTKWEGHHTRSMDYIHKAAAAAGKRPSLGRESSGSYWSPRKSMDDERRPTSSRGRNDYDELPPRPPMPNHTSAPSGLKSRVDERSTKEPRRSATGSYPIREKGRDSDYRKEMGTPPSLGRSQTMPAPKSSSKRDAAPSKSSNLKHTETQDSGYGTSSTIPTPELRGESPGRRPAEKSTKYHIVEPNSDDDDRTQVRRVDSDSDQHRRRHHSPETLVREPRKEKSQRGERPKLDASKRSKTAREALSDRPKPSRSQTSRNTDARSPRDATPPLSRHGSARDKLPYEMSDSDRDVDRDRESSRYKYGPDKVNVRPPYPEAQYASYRESPDRRGYDQSPGSRFHEGVRGGGSRRPSVY